MADEPTPLADAHPDPVTRTSTPGATSASVPAPATQNPDDRIGEDRERIHRFSVAERLVHRGVAILMLTCMSTAAILYNAQLAVPIGHRRLVKLIHVYSGLALPVPIVIGICSAAYRADVGRLNRFTSTDWRWLRSRSRRDGTIPVGKFNAGQKLNAALSSGAILVLFGTGTLMYFPNLARLSWRTGATFVHDWFALAVGLLVIGHISYAIRDPESRRGMRTGQVSASWARAQHSDWATTELGAKGDSEAAGDPVTGRRGDAR